MTDYFKIKDDSTYATFKLNQVSGAEIKKMLDNNNWQQLIQVTHKQASPKICFNAKQCDDCLRTLVNEEDMLKAIRTKLVEIAQTANTTKKRKNGKLLPKKNRTKFDIDEIFCIDQQLSMEPGQTDYVYIEGYSEHLNKLGAISTFDIGKFKNYADAKKFMDTEYRHSSAYSDLFTNINYCVDETKTASIW